MEADTGLQKASVTLGFRVPQEKVTSKSKGCFCCVDDDDISVDVVNVVVAVGCLVGFTCCCVFSFFSNMI